MEFRFERDTSQSHGDKSNGLSSFNKIGGFRYGAVQLCPDTQEVGNVE